MEFAQVYTMISNRLMLLALTVVVVSLFTPCSASDCTYSDPAADVHRVGELEVYGPGLPTVDAGYVDVQSFSVLANTCTLVVSGGLSTVQEDWIVSFYAWMNDSGGTGYSQVVLLFNGTGWTATLVTFAGFFPSIEIVYQPTIVVTDTTITFEFAGGVDCYSAPVGYGYRAVNEDIYYVDYFPDEYWYGGESSSTSGLTLPHWTVIVIVCTVGGVVLAALGVLLSRRTSKKTTLFDDDPEAYCSEDDHSNEERCAKYAPRHESAR